MKIPKQDPDKHIFNTFDRRSYEVVGCQDTLNDSVAGTPHSQLPESKHDANFIAKTKNVHSVALAQAAALPEV